MSLRTTDLDSTGASRYYTTAKLGPKRSLTPEGYLLCLDVPVARTGEMLYAEGEIASEDGQIIAGGPDKLIRVTRGPEELFRPETLASGQGKSVTVTHPDDFVGPDNVKQFEGGVMLNTRRGTGIEDDLMLADLLVKDRAAIAAIQEEEIEEVSLGYEADYEQDAPGRARQRNILINHVALVERGRCGPRCAIGDQDMPALKKSWKDRMMAAFKTGDEKEVEKVASEVKDEEEESAEEREKRERSEKDKKTEDTLQKVLDKLNAMDEDMKELKQKVESKDGDGDGEEEDGDGDATTDAILSAETAHKLDDAGVKLYTGDAAKHIPQLAEILAPGTKLPTFDGKTTDAQRAAALCQCQRNALAKAYATDASRELIKPFLGGQKADFKKLPYAIVNAAFHGAASLMRAQNNDRNRQASVTTRDFGKRITPADINARNREYYKR